MPVYRVLIVDDSPFMRQLFSDMVNADGAFTVASTAGDGEEALKLVLELQPDVITMDMEMPKMNGLEALRRIMAARPTPVVMLSAVTDNGTRDTIKALQYGAFDFIRKPDGAADMDIGQVGGQLLEKLHIAAESIAGGTFRRLQAAQADVSQQADAVEQAAPALSPAREAAGELAITEPLSEWESPKPGEGPESHHAAVQIAPAVPPPAIDPGNVPLKKTRELQTPGTPGGKRRSSRSSPEFSQIVAVGTSTGGPRALHEVLTRLPEDFEAPVLVVQHMPPRFTSSLAQRLDSLCAICVREASQDEVVESATAYIAPGGKQMSVCKGTSGTYRIKLTEEGPRSGHMPSVDVLFESLVGLRSLKRHAVLMTGMGSDGAKGMKALQEDGAETRIAEAEETCIVYGMPRSAVEIGAVSHVLPLQQIASFLVRQVKSRNQA